MLNWWCITWPVGFKRLIKKEKEAENIKQQKCSHEVEDDSSIEQGNSDLPSEGEYFTQDSSNIDESWIN
jgi:hypothetical protein